MSTHVRDRPRWLLRLVRATADRGVQVQLLVSGPHVQRSGVQLRGEVDSQHLLDSGVEIWRYQPALFETKAVLVDGVVAPVAS